MHLLYNRVLPAPEVLYCQGLSRVLPMDGDNCKLLPKFRRSVQTPRCRKYFFFSMHSQMPFTCHIGMVAAFFQNFGYCDTIAVEESFVSGYTPIIRTLLTGIFKRVFGHLTDTCLDVDIALSLNWRGRGKNVKCCRIV